MLVWMDQKCTLLWWELLKSCPTLPEGDRITLIAWRIWVRSEYLPGNPPVEHTPQNEKNESILQISRKALAFCFHYHPFAFNLYPCIFPIRTMLKKRSFCSLLLMLWAQRKPRFARGENACSLSLSLVPTMVPDGCIINLGEQRDCFEGKKETWCDNQALLGNIHSVRGFLFL